MWPCETGKIGTHLGKFKKIMSCWYEKNPVQSRYFLLDVRFSFPGHEADRNSTRWWWLGTLIQLPLGADAMYGNSREKDLWRADNVYKLGVNEKNIPRSPCSFIFEKKTMTNKNTFKITWELDYVSNIYFSFHFG